MKIIKYALITCFAILSSLVIALLIINSTNINLSKPYVSDIISEAIGRKLNLKGDIKIRLLPSLSLIVDDVQLENADWSDPEYLVDAKSIEIMLEYKPLFFGEVEISGISLNGILLNLHRKEVKGSNWEFNLKKGEENNKVKKDVTRKLPFNPKVNIALENIVVNFDDELLNFKHKVVIEKLTLVNENEKTRIDIDAQYNEEDINIQLKTILLKDILKDEDIPVKLIGDIGNIHLKIATNIPLSKEAAEKVKSEFSIRTEDLSMLKKFTGNEIYEPGLIDINGNISYSKNLINLNFKNSKVGKTKLEGYIKYSPLATRPKIYSKLKINDLDLVTVQDWLEENETDNQGARKVEDATLFSQAPLDFYALKKYDFDINLLLDGVDHKLLEINYKS